MDIVEEFAAMNPPLVLLGENSEYYTVYVQSAARLFARKTSFVKEEQRASYIAAVDQSVKVGGDYIHAPSNSGILGKDIKTEDSPFNQTTSDAKQTEKKWWQKWVDEFIKNAIQFSVTGLITFLSGLIIGKSCNPADIPKSSQQSNPRNGIDTSHSENTILLDSIQKN
jgi:hypothetical protein